MKNLVYNVEKLDHYGRGIARDNGIPVLGVRMISNNEINEETYEKGLGKILQENIIKLIDRINVGQ